MYILKKSTLVTYFASNTRYNLLLLKMFSIGHFEVGK